MTFLLQRVLGFERLIGPTLVKLVYWVGLAAIVIACGLGLMAGLGALFSGNLGEGFVRLLATPVVAAATLIGWRFACELFMLSFLAFERLGEVRDLMRRATGAPDPNHPQF
jgi:uncharacterized membrane protein